jgi:hypothetical protein
MPMSVPLSSCTISKPPTPALTSVLLSSCTISKPPTPALTSVLLSSCTISKPPTPALTLLYRCQSRTIGRPRSPVPPFHTDASPHWTIGTRILYPSLIEEVCRYTKMTVGLSSEKKGGYRRPSPPPPPF